MLPDQIPEQWCRDEGVITIGTEKPAPVEVRVAAGGGVQVRAGGRGPLGTTFRIPGMTPGRYKVFALRGIPTPFAEQNREFMKPFEPYGVVVDISLSDQAPNITVPLVPEFPGR